MKGLATLSEITVSVGCSPSSGSTFLADVLDSVPAAACGPELSLLNIPRAYIYDEYFRQNCLRLRWPIECVYTPTSRFVHQRNLDYYGMSKGMVENLIQHSSSLPDFVGKFRIQYSNYRARPISMLVDKTPSNLNCARQFLDTFPNGYLVHLVRDGREVVASLLRRGYSLWGATTIWMAQTWTGLQLREHPRCITLNFDALLRDPFRTAAELAETVGLGPQDSSEIEYRFRHNSYRRALTRPSTWTTNYKSELSVGKPLAFTSVLSPQQVAFVEAVATLHRHTATKVEFVSLMSAIGKQMIGPEPLRYETVVGALLEYLQQDFGSFDTRNWLTVTSSRNATVSHLVSSMKLDEIVNVAQTTKSREMKFNYEKDFSQVALMQGLIPADRFKRFPLDRTLSYHSRLELIQKRRLENYQTRELGGELPNLTDFRYSKNQSQAVISQIIGAHLYACHRKLVAEKFLSHEELVTLLLCVSVIRNKHEADSVITDIEKLTKERLSFTGSMEEFLEDLEYFDSALLLFLRNCVKGIKCHRPPIFQNEVKSSLVHLIGEKRRETVRTLENIIREHVDPKVGLVVLRAATTSGNAPRPYLSALVPLGFLLALGRLGHSVTLTQPHVERPIAPAGGDVNLWRQHICDLAQPPALTRALAHQKPDSYFASTQDLVSRELIAQQVRRFGYAIRVQPRSSASAFVMSIRQDVDRPLSRSDERVLGKISDGYANAMSVFFRPNTFGKRQAMELFKAGCELGLHVSRWDEEHYALKSQLEDIVQSRVGVTYHGGLGSDFWRGYQTLREDASRGILYSELLHEWFANPFSIAFGHERLMVTPLSIKVDAQPEWVPSQLELVLKHSGHAILEFHPDKWGRENQTLIDKCFAMGAEGRSVSSHVDTCSRIEQVRATISFDDGKTRIGASLSADMSFEIFLNDVLQAPLNQKNIGSSSTLAFEALQIRCIQVVGDSLLVEPRV